MEQPAQVMPMTKSEFWDKYWFTPLHMITVVNPLGYDFKFMVEGRNYMIQQGHKEKIPGTIANVFLTKITRIMAQDDDKMQHLSDYALMKQYYDKVIVDVEGMIKEESTRPAYLNDIPESMKAGEPETPPWQVPVKSSIPKTNSQMRDTVGEEPQPTNADGTHILTPDAKEETKEFEFEGSKFRMTIDKNDKETFFRDGKRIDAAAYSKAASMI